MTYTFIVRAVNEIGEKGKYVTTSCDDESKVSYQSDNTAVISVSQSGELTVHKASIVKITAAKMGDMAYEYASMYVTANRKPISVSSATLTRP